MIYPDTSFWVALRVKGELHHDRAFHWYEAHEREQWSWSPWPRAEVFNTIRQLARVGIISKTEASMGTRTALGSFPAKREALTCAGATRY